MKIANFDKYSVYFCYSYSL